MSANRRVWTVVSLAVLYTVWGSTYLAQRIAVSTFAPLQMVGVRFLVAGGLLFGLLRARGEKGPTRMEWRNAAISATPLMLFGMGTAAFALRRVPSGLAALVFAAVPLFASVFSRAFGRRLLATEIAGLGLGIMGVGCVSLRGGLAADPLGAGLLIFAAASYAFGCVLTARMPIAKGAMGTASQMVFAGVALTIASLVHGDHWVVPTRGSLLSLAYLIVLGSMVAYTALGYLLRSARPALATSYAFVNPIVALGLGHVLAAEPIAKADLVGLLFVLAAVATVSLRSRATPLDRSRDARHSSDGLRGAEITVARR